MNEKKTMKRATCMAAAIWLAAAAGGAAAQTAVAAKGASGQSRSDDRMTAIELRHFAFYNDFRARFAVPDERALPVAADWRHTSGVNERNRPAYLSCPFGRDGR